MTMNSSAETERAISACKTESDGPAGLVEAIPAAIKNTLKLAKIVKTSRPSIPFTLPSQAHNDFIQKDPPE